MEAREIWKGEGEESFLQSIKNVFRVRISIILNDFWYIFIKTNGRSIGQLRRWMTE